MQSFSERLRGLGRAIAPFFSIIVALASIALPVSLALGGVSSGFTEHNANIMLMNTMLQFLVPALCMLPSIDSFERHTNDTLQLLASLILCSGLLWP